MEFRNIHFSPGADDAPAPASEAVAPEAAAVAIGDRLRIRHTTVSPHEEYQLRDGETRPISDALAAMILSCKGRVEISLKGVKIDRKEIGGVRIYGHPDSVVCNDLSQRERKMFYVLNRQRPDIVHILDETGRYLESIPEKDTPGVLDNDAQAKEFAANRRVHKRVAAHLQNLHGKETEQALQDLAANNAEMQRVVQTLPAPDAKEDVQPAPSSVGDRIQRGETRINDFRKNRASTVSFGRAVASEPRFTSTDRAADVSEDWSDRSQINTSQPTHIEQW